MNVEHDAAVPAVSIVIPAYRAEGTIARTIESALAQEGVELRIIVVVDGTFDRTVDIARSYSRYGVTVEVHETNRGAAVTRNDGLALVDTEFVMFLDADDLIEGPLLKGLVRSIEEAGADVGFGPMQILHMTSGRHDALYIPDFGSSEDIFRKWHLGGIYVSPCSVLWRTDFIRRIGGWDPEVTRNDDGEMVMRAVLLGAKIAVSREGRGIYVKHTGESLNSRTDNMASMLRVNEKLIALASTVISPEVRRHVFAGHYLNVAWQCYLGRQDRLGDEALKRGLAMGAGRWGPRHYRLPFRLLGVKRTAKIVGQAKRMLGRPAS